MRVAEHIQHSLALPDMVVRSYLSDLTDEELLLRPYTGMNHIAWQLGHLISSENLHMRQVAPDGMPLLPEDFAARHSRETAPRDDPAMFCSKADYLRLMDEQRAGTLRILLSLSDDQLAEPSPESVRYLGPNVSSIFAGEAVHWMMHAGQWAVVRRMLGKQPLF